MYDEQEADPKLIEEAFSGSEKEEWTIAIAKGDRITSSERCLGYRRITRRA